MGGPPSGAAGGDAVSSGGGAGPSSSDGLVPDAVVAIVGPKAAASAPTTREYEADEHLLSLPELAARFPASGVDTAAPTASTGLSSAAAAAKLAADGPNRLTPPKETPEWVKFLRGFADPFMVVLIVAGALCFLVRRAPDERTPLPRAPARSCSPPPPRARRATASATRPSRLTPSSAAS